MKQSRKFLISLLAFVMLLSGARVPQQSTDNSFKSGLAKYNDGDYAGAIEDYTHVIEIDPENASAHRNRAKAKCRLADTEFARGNVEKARGLYHAGVADYDKSIKLKKSVDADALTTDLASEEGRASTVRVMRWSRTSNGFFMEVASLWTWTRLQRISMWLRAPVPFSSSYLIGR